MSRIALFRFALSASLALAPLAAAAQAGATKPQVDAVTAVAECLATGLPEKWKELRVVVDIRKPYAETGGVIYVVTLPDNNQEPFQPCDPMLAPVKLIGLRDDQTVDQRGWTKVILTMKPDASFDLKYEYPAASKK